jgi:RNA polymerase sigma factor (sigma-70 family)
MTHAARNALVLEYRGHVVQSAHTIQRHAPRVEWQDLVSAGNLALVQALDCYEPRRNPNLKAHLNVKMRCLIIDQLRESKDMLRGERFPVFVDITALPNALAAKTDSPFDAAERAERAGKVQRAVEKLPARWQRVLRLVYWDDLSGKEAAERIGVGETRVWQIRRKAIERLRREMSR